MAYIRSLVLRRRRLLGIVLTLLVLLAHAILSRVIVVAPAVPHAILNLMNVMTALLAVPLVILSLPQGRVLSSGEAFELESA